jgi:hypothetical protein
MLDFAYNYKEAINQITDRCEIKLQDYKIEPHEWDVIRQLQDILGVCPLMYKTFFLTYHTSITGFQGCNTLFSHGGTQNIASVISAMDHLDKHLASIATSPKYGRVIKAAIVLGKKTLNRYYNHMDHSEVYQIVMSMFPFSPMF